ncbi:hypothetical protein OG790_26325 [Streptomyces cellulosae]
MQPLSDYDRSFIPQLCAVLPLVAREEPEARTRLYPLWVAFNAAARQDGHEGMPIGVFRRLVLATGYGFNQRTKTLYGLRLTAPHLLKK